MKRPLGVGLLAVLAIASGVSGILYGLGLFFVDFVLLGRQPPGREIFALTRPTAWVWAVETAGVPCGLGIIYAAVGIGLWKLRRWARGAAILLLILNIAVLAALATSLWTLSGFWEDLWLLLAIAGFHGLCLGYMFMGEVKRAFSNGRPSVTAGGQ